MKRLLVLTLCASFVSPSITLASGEDATNGRLNLSGESVTATLRMVVHMRSQSAPQQSPNDDKLWGMPAWVPITLIAAGAGAGIGSIKGISDKDAEGKSIPGTADRKKGALVGAAVGAGVVWIMALSCMAGRC